MQPTIAELSRAGPLYEPERFKQVQLSEYLAAFIKENPQSYTRIRLNRLLLEAAYPKEIARSLGGVYPDREIYIPTPAGLPALLRRVPVGRRAAARSSTSSSPARTSDHVGDKMQVSGQVAVMAINGLLTKVIFDHNPKNEFYVEESFPLKWMYPHLTPFGIIMKINRQPLPELTEEIVRQDHEFWTQYSERLIGNWITYDTSVKEIAAVCGEGLSAPRFQRLQGRPQVRPRRPGAEGLFQAAQLHCRRLCLARQRSRRIRTRSSSSG